MDYVLTVEIAEGKCWSTNAHVKKQENFTLGKHKMDSRKESQGTSVKPLEQSKRGQGSKRQGKD